mmetsp:Transcript_11051/g.25301  ORF Transcript_11051/g.25301 Transcript_11051/m.25301 type:complete len:168 (+) Transcript_11051:85-588(+)
MAWEDVWSSLWHPSAAGSLRHHGNVSELTRDFCQSHAPTAETTLSAPGCRASSSGCLHTAFAAEEMKRKFLSQLVHEMLRRKNGRFLSCPRGVRDCEPHVDCLPHPWRHRNQCHIEGAERGEWGPACIDNADSHCRAAEREDGGFLLCEKEHCKWKSFGYKRAKLGL